MNCTQSTDSNQTGPGLAKQAEQAEQPAAGHQSVLFYQLSSVFVVSLLVFSARSVIHKLFRMWNISGLGHINTQYWQRQAGASHSCGREGLLYPLAQSVVGKQ